MILMRKRSINYYRKIKKNLEKSIKIKKSKIKKNKINENLHLFGHTQ